MKTIISVLKSLCFYLILETGCCTNIFALSDTTKEDDYTFGAGGTKTVIINRDKRYKYDKITLISDRSHNQRERITVYTDSNNVMLKRHIYCQCGLIVRVTEISHDLLGNEFLNGEARYDIIRDSLKTISGFIKEIDENEKKHIHRYNSKTEDWEELKDDISFIQPPCMTKIDSCPLPFIKNQLFLGGTLIREDSKPTGFNTYGGDLVFQHFLTPGFGITAEGVVTTGTNSGIKYNKEIGLVGAFARIINKAREKNAISVDAHVLVGVSFIGSSFGSYKNTSNYFTAELGGNLDLPISKNISWRIIQADVLPTFSKSNTQYNFKFVTGFVLKMNSKTKIAKTREKDYQTYNVGNEKDSLPDNSILQTKVREKFPNQPCKTDECWPAALSNSLQWLNTKFSMGVKSDLSINEMKKAIGWKPPIKNKSGTGGVTLDNVINGKRDYCKKNNILVVTDDPNELQNVKKLFPDLIKLFDAGYDIEFIYGEGLGKGQKSHVAAVIGIKWDAKANDGAGRAIITIADDPKQDGNPKSHDLTIDFSAGGDYSVTDDLDPKHSFSWGQFVKEHYDPKLKK